MTAHAKMGTETSWNERMSDIAAWVATIDGVVLWICSIFAKDIAHSYLLAPIYLAIGILLMDWILMWGTDAPRLRRVVDRRMIMAFVGLAFVFRVWANDVLLNETAIERDYPVFLIMSGISLAAAAGSLLLLAVKGRDWHLAGHQRNPGRLERRHILRHPLFPACISHPIRRSAELPMENLPGVCRGRSGSLSALFDERDFLICRAGSDLV